MAPLKKFFLAILLASAFIMSSCTKEDDTFPRSEGFVKFKIGDEWTTWPLGKADIVLDATDLSKRRFNLGVNNSSKDSSLFLSFGIDASVIEPGTYDLEKASFLVTYYGESVTYRENQSLPGLPAPKYTITLTEITDKHIKGKFSGNLLISTYTNEYIALTEGEFLLPATIHESPF